MIVAAGWICFLVASGMVGWLAIAADNIGLGVLALILFLIPTSSGRK
jgi:hypothetical protein